eukprot:1195571-Prorocentrum_minimum.AAC.7
MLDISLSVRKYSPKVQFTRTLAEGNEPADASGNFCQGIDLSVHGWVREDGSCCWVQMGDVIATNVDELRVLTEKVASSKTSAAPELFDHVHPDAVPGELPGHWRI